MNRQIREERVEYEQMRAALGDRMPYETLGGFRRAKRAESETYENAKRKYKENLSAEEKAKQNKYSDSLQYARYAEVLGKKNLPESLDKFQEMKYNEKEGFAKLERQFKDTKLQKRIRSGEYDLTIHDGKQGKHIQGHNNYIQGKSYLTISIEEAQELVKKYAGTGEIKRTLSGEWKHQEVIDVHRIIGISVNKKRETETMKLKIHYSKSGVHVVPISEED